MLTLKTNHRNNSDGNLSHHDHHLVRDPKVRSLRNLGLSVLAV